MRLVIKKFFARFREPFTKTLILAVVAAFAFWGLVLLDTFQDPLSPLGRDVMRYVADGEARGLSSATRSIGVRPTVPTSQRLSTQMRNSSCASLACCSGPTVLA